VGGGEKRCLDLEEVWRGKPAGKNHFEDLGANGRRVFKCVLRNWIRGRGLYSCGPG
jgi:hypothetical protein